MRCQRKVGPGCTPGCLLVELRGTARERVGLCADWPHCRAPGVEVSRVQAVTEALFPAGQTGARTGRALRPAGAAFVQYLLKVIVIATSLIGRAGGDRTPQVDALFGHPASWDQQFSYTSGLTTEAGRLEENFWKLEQDVGSCVWS